MNPHLFRHVMAKIYLDANPGEYEVVRRVLAHRSIDTTTRYYLWDRDWGGGSSFRQRDLGSAHEQKSLMTQRLHQDPDRRCKLIEEWPEVDRGLWQASLVPGDLFEAGGSRAEVQRIYEPRDC